LYFILANYSLGRALTRTWDARSSTDWQHVAVNFDPACQGAIDYVIDISDGMTDDILVYSTMLLTNTSTPLLCKTPKVPTS
jgi:hypothetical protein